MALCRPGERIWLKREPNNPHDRMAVAVITVRGVQVGYLASRYAVWIGSKIDRGTLVQAIVERVKGEHLQGSPLGLVIRINMEGEEPDLAA